MIEGFYLNINGRIDNGEKVLSLCCESIPDVPAIAFSDTAEETLRRFIGERALVIAESKKGSGNDSKHRFTGGCSNCANYQLNDWVSDGRIYYVNLSMYPAPCQSHCIYCGVHRTGLDGKAREAYERLFEFLELVKDSGLLSENALWQISSGEIAIHPYRERIMKLVGSHRAVFYTNCFKFDEGIAQNLHDNPKSAINLSIDAGLPETWRKIKGVNNFETVISNLVEYYKWSARPGQITLKYIVLPGLNDTYEDYLSVIEIMKVLEVKHLTIARDTSKKYSMGTEEGEQLTGAAGYLAAMCHKNGITNDMFTYTPEERERVISFANELLQNGVI